MATPDQPACYRQGGRDVAACITIRNRPHEQESALCHDLTVACVLTGTPRVEPPERRASFGASTVHECSRLRDEWYGSRFGECAGSLEPPVALVILGCPAGWVPGLTSISLPVQTDQEVRLAVA